MAMDPISRAGLLLCSLVIIGVASLVAGWPGLLAPIGLAIIGVAAGAVGADSREPGDWRRAGSP
jgi:hypothetical protein